MNKLQRAVSNIIKDYDNKVLSHDETVARLSLIANLDDQEKEYLFDLRSMLQRSRTSVTDASIQLFLYDALYLPLNNYMASLGLVREDDGQLS